MTDQTIILVMIISGILLSLHPLLLSVFIALIAGAFGKNKQRSSVYTIAGSYILALSVVVGLLGLGLSMLANSLSSSTLYRVGLATGIVAVLWGLFSAKDYFWYGSHPRTPGHITELLHRRTTDQISAGSALVLSFAAAYAALFTIAIPVAALSIISSLVRPLQPSWILIFVIGLSVPLVSVLIAAGRGLKLSAILRWKEDNKAILRLSIGLLNIILGWIIFLLLSGSIGTVL